MPDNEFQSILAIDAAWTSSEPSAVALLQKLDGEWCCRALAPSYAQFNALVNNHAVDWNEKPKGQFPDIPQLLATAKVLMENHEVSLITVDMPVSTEVIMGYREAERAISRAFSRHGCAAHAPSVNRPGNISQAYTDNLRSWGFQLGVSSTATGTTKRMLEVYPHPALLRLMDVDYRLEYKAAKTSRYWPDLAIPERKQKLFYIYRRILEALGQSMTNISLSLPGSLVDQPFSHFKRYEDAIDALVCGWVGIQYLQGKASPYGDNSGAIWVPD